VEESGQFMQLIARVVEEGGQLVRLIARIVEVDNSWNCEQGLWK
jgi:hypothetical protein